VDIASVVGWAISAIRVSRYDESRCEGTAKHDGEKNALGEPDTHDGKRASAMVSSRLCIDEKMWKKEGAVC
jgi:hypothetical protein